MQTHKAIEGWLTHRQTIVVDTEGIELLYKEGYFGKIRQNWFSTAIPPHKNALVQTLEETFYLLSYSKLLMLRIACSCDICNTINKLSTYDNDTLLRYFTNIDTNFPIRYRIYSCLRQNRYIPKDGASLGADFIVYEKNPQIYHSIFILHIIMNEKSFSIEKLQTHIRIATGARKGLLYAALGISSPLSLTTTLESLLTTKVVFRLFKRWTSNQDIVSLVS